MKTSIRFRFPEGSTNQSINHQGRLTTKASATVTYRGVLPKASALAGVEGYQLNPSQGAGLPILGEPAKGSTLGTRRRQRTLLRFHNVSRSFELSIRNPTCHANLAPHAGLSITVRELSAKGRAHLAR